MYVVWDTERHELYPSQSLARAIRDAAHSNYVFGRKLMKVRVMSEEQVAQAYEEETRYHSCDCCP